MKSNKSRKYHYIISHLLQSVKPGFMFIVRAKLVHVKLCYERHATREISLRARVFIN